MKKVTESERLLRRAQGEVDTWRSHHAGLGRMPNALWQLAAEAAAACGVDEAASRLGLNPRRLKAWVDKLESVSTSEPSLSPFLEVPLAWPVSSECVLELKSTSGLTLRVRLTGEAISQAESLGRVLGSVWT